MSRPWIKVHTIMLHHPGIGRLSDGAYRAWITCLLMAAAGEELGQCGAFEDVAWQMHWSPEQLDAALAEIGDRIQREDGVLYVRDWDEWQERESAKERQRRHRGKVRDASQPASDEQSPPARDAAGSVCDGHVTVTSPSGKGHGEVTFPRARSRNPDPEEDTNPEQNNQPGVETVVAASRDIAPEKGVTRACAREGPPPDCLVAAEPTARPKEASPAKRNGQAPRKLPPHVSDPDLWAALCRWFQLPTEPGGLSVHTAANLRRLAAVYLKAGEGAEMAEADARVWYRDDWRGQKNQPPTVPQAQDCRARCRAKGHAPPGRETEGPEWREEPELSDEDWEAIQAAAAAGDHFEAARLANLAAEHAYAAAAAKANGNGSVSRGA